MILTCFYQKPSKLRKTISNYMRGFFLLQGCPGHWRLAASENWLMCGMSSSCYHVWPWSQSHSNQLLYKLAYCSRGCHWSACTTAGCYLWVSANRNLNEMALLNTAATALLLCSFALTGNINYYGSCFYAALNRLLHDSYSYTCVFLLSSIIICAVLIATYNSYIAISSSCWFIFSRIISFSLSHYCLFPFPSLFPFSFLFLTRKSGTALLHTQWLLCLGTRLFTRQKFSLHQRFQLWLGQ